MRSIAGVTGGRYYFPSDPNELPSIFIKEAKTLRRSMIQNKVVSPEIGFPSPVLKGIDTLPELRGYVLTSAKGRARTALQVTIQDDEGQEETDPILAVWRYGLGTTAAFTSDLSPNWGAEWIDWEHRKSFVSQLVTQISRVKKQGHLRMWTYVQGNEGVIVVEDFHPDESFLDVQARVTGPRNRVENLKLKQLGPRRYQGTVPLWGKGRYQVMAVGAAGERSDRAHGGLILPYSPEYLRFRSDPIVLNTISHRTDGAQLDANSTADLIYGRRQPKTSSRRIFDWFLIALACLIPIDVGLRRVQLDWKVVQSWFGLGGKKGETTPMMGTLLQRKRDVSLRLQGQQDDIPKPLPRQVTRARPGGAPRKPAKSDAPASGPAIDLQQLPRDQEDLSTTERLLEMKRKRNEEDEE